MTTNKRGRDFGHTLKAALFTSCVGIGMLAVSAPVFAQDQKADGEEAAPAEAIIITGSRIARKDFSSNSPIVTVGSDLLQNSGTSAVEVNLNKLPQFTPEKTPTQGGDIQATPTNTPGSATISLRGIGSNRNLVLIDGRRVTPANASMAVDINSIPSAAIERVEIISGGASSTYGADAVGGVVNFILKKNFQGLQLDSQIGITQRGDGREYKISGIMGTDFADGKGNISVAMETNDRAPSYNRNRPWYQSVYSSPSIGGNLFFPYFPGISNTGGTTNANYQNVLNSMFPNRGTTNISTSSTLYFVSGVPFTNGASGAPGDLAGTTNFPSSLLDGAFTKKTSNGAISQNFAVDYSNLPLNRFNFYARGHYDITDWVSVVAQGYFNKSHTETVQQPSPIVGGWNVVVPRYINKVVNGVTYNDSTWLPANLTALLNARTDPTASWSPTGYVPGLGNRAVYSDVYTYNMMAGLEGSIPGTDWTWDITGSQGESLTTALTTGVASLERLRAVMSAPNFGAGFNQIGNAAGGTFGASRATCTSGLNPFSSAAISADCVAAVNADLKETATMQQTVWEANIQGKVIDLPAGDLRTSMGATYRRNKYTFLEDTLKTSGSSFQDQALGIYPAKNVIGSIAYKEVYGEVSIPLLKDIPLIKSLELDAGIRYSDSSVTGGSTTWKAELNWEVASWLRLRGTYNKAQRAPNLGELYSFTQNFAVLTGGDACSTGNPFAYSAKPTNTNGAQVLALCKQLMDKTSIPNTTPNSIQYYGNGLATTDPAYIAPSVGSQSTSTAPGFAFPYFIGNPSLKPEDATTFTIGAVVTSPFEAPMLRRMRLTLDYYSIDVKNAIGLQSGQTLQQQCLDAAFNPTFNPNSFACNNFARGTGGGIGAVQLAYTNTGAFKTQGLDVQFDWNFPAGPGSLGVNTVFNYLFSMKSSPFYSGVPTASQTPFREYAGTLLAPDSGLSGNGNYRWKVFTTFSYSLDGYNVGLQWQHLPAIASGTTNSGIPAYDLFALNASARITKAFSLRAGVDNLFDKAPPLWNVNPNPVGAGLPGGALAGSTYDNIGRRFYVGATAKF
jgi:outer membrane receptor protein involved in Fe transport